MTKRKPPGTKLKPGPKPKLKSVVPVQKIRFSLQDLSLALRDKNGHRYLSKTYEHLKKVFPEGFPEYSDEAAKTKARKYSAPVVLKWINSISPRSDGWYYVESSEASKACRVRTSEEAQSGL